MGRSRDLTEPQLFLDDSQVEETRWLNRVWHQPRKLPAPVLEPEYPWEEWCPVIYGTVLHWQGRFRMWYCNWTRKCRSRVCYAESTNGVNWTKPKLGLCAFDGDKDNNIVMASGYEAPALIDDLTVIDDPLDAEWPLKMLYWDGRWKAGPQGYGIHMAQSKDGLNWERSPGLVLPGWGDRFNAISAKHDGKYVVYGRKPKANGPRRAVWRTESADLREWTDPELVLTADAEDPAPMQYYSVSVFPYGHLLLGAIERMHVTPDRLDSEIAWSADGRKWERSRLRSPFLEWGAPGAWDDTWINLPTNEPIRQGAELWFYYSGRSAAHHAPYPLNRGGVGLSILREDGFASLKAETREGYVRLKPVRWPGGELLVNFDPRIDPHSYTREGIRDASEDGGVLRVEAMVPDGSPIVGFARDDCEPLRRNTVALDHACLPIRWKSGKSMRELAGKDVRLVFHFRQGHLYSYRAG